VLLLQLQIITAGYERLLMRTRVTHCMPGSPSEAGSETTGKVHYRTHVRERGFVLPSNSKSQRWKVSGHARARA